MKYIAHKIDETGEVQTLREHLVNTARLCRDNAIDEFKELAYICGLLHDVGKYTRSFQKRINGANIKVEHSRYGASLLNDEYKEICSAMLQYCIAGHHSGMPDGGTVGEPAENPTLNAMLQREKEDFSDFRKEIDFCYPVDATAKHLKRMKSREDIIELFAFFSRYMYSCLTDADFIDTERFFNPETERGLYGDFQKAYERICKRITEFEPETPIQRTRKTLQEQVYRSMEKDSDIYIIDMPTGSGKTLCSVKAALEKAISKNKKRIIYVIPYVSIIEQTADVLEGIFGDVLPILQHHSNYDYEESEYTSTAEKLKRTCENWDASFIITTNVQFFESLYHHKSSRMRKLHNLADSVIIFDEIHMLPLKYIKPCMRAIGYVSKYLNSIAIMMSATMPDYKSFIGKYSVDSDITETLTDKSRLGVFKKCRYSYIGRCSNDDLILRANEYDSALIVVNSRKAARELYQECNGNKYHLSTYMTAKHRSEVIRHIRCDLKNGRKVIVISTSLIEAGVDLDFRCVFRENAGLDNIIQSAGRCNREGRYEYGDVIIFEKGDVRGELQIKANITRSLFEEYTDISDENCISEYYRRLFEFSKNSIDKEGITELMLNYSFWSVPFRTYSQSFAFIDNSTLSIVIPNKENAKLIEELQYGKLSNKRKLQCDSATVYFYEFEELLKQGVLKQVNDVYVLANPDYYDSKALGLMLEGKDIVL